MSGGYGPGLGADALDSTTPYDLRVDPRTSLAIIDVPEQYRSIFPHLQGTIIHFLEIVSKFSHRGHMQRRFLIVSDSCIYLTWENGKLCRAIPVKILSSVLHNNNIVCFRVRPPDEFDLAVEVPDGSPYGGHTPLSNTEYLLEVVRRIYKANVEQRLEEIRTPNPVAQCNLVRPDGWKLKTKQLKSIKSLALSIESRNNRQEAEKRLVQDRFAQIQAALRQEFEAYRDREYQKLRAEVDALQGELQKRDAEIAMLRVAGGSASCANCKEREGQEAERVHVLERELAEKVAVIGRLTESAGPSRAALEADLAARREKIIALKRDIQQLVEDLDLERRKRETETESHEKDARRLKSELDEARSELQKKTLLAAPLQSEATLRAMLAGRDKEIHALRQQLDRARGDAKQAYDQDTNEIRGKLSITGDENARLKIQLAETLRRQAEDIENVRRSFACYDEQMVAYVQRICAANPTVASSVIVLIISPRPLTVVLFVLYCDFTAESRLREVMQFVTRCALFGKLNVKMLCNASIKMG